jgi:quercetin dioxygenase-like cupin family protein
VPGACVVSFVDSSSRRDVQDIAREFIHVLEGTIRVEIEGLEPIVLEPGDTAYYRSDRPHKLANGGAVPARFVGAVAPPNW